MRLHRDPETGLMTRFPTGNLSHVHPAEACEGFFCDIHNRRPDWEAKYPLNWREDRGMMEFICEHGVGHPTTAQRVYWARVGAGDDAIMSVHGCDGCCHNDYEGV